MTVISPHLRSHGGSLAARRISPSNFNSAASISLPPPQPPQAHLANQIPPSDSNSESQSARNLLISLIESCTKKTHLLQIHALIVRTYLIQDSYISQLFLSRAAISPVRKLSYARLVFGQIRNPILPHYNTMIRAYSMSNFPIEGFYIYRNMLSKGVRPDPLSSSFAVKSCIKISSLTGGVQIHAKIYRNGHDIDVFLLTTLMDLYSSCEKYNEACKMFDEMPQRDVVVWNVLISCCVRNNRTRDALNLFEIMQSQNYQCQPDEVTCLHLLQACSSLNALEFGERVHHFIEDHGYGEATNLCNSLIAMYSRCGSLDKANEVFEKMKNKNVVSWSCMISGLAINGHGREAIKAFAEMQKIGVRADEQTLTGVLSACSHGGLVDEGMTIFNLMSKKYGIFPNIHHYGCMVDLLGRAGLLDQAYHLITSMEVKPDATVWRTLLGSCRIHRYESLAERVIQHLIEIKAQEAGDYVLLLNIYSSAENWEKVREIRKFMQERGIHTSSGCSTIESGGVVHEFIVDDVSHLRKDEIYEKLDEINKQLKIGGYVAEISSELHKLSLEEKGNSLSYHSEKLAIAFGVLATPPGKTIRVAKNLRTCVDCHNFAKALSSVYNREVVVRDRSRFHHFRHGRCSCNDYW